MSPLHIDLNNPRATKAGVASLFDKQSLRKLSWAIAFISALAGVYLLIISKSSAGYLPFGITGIFTMLMFWYHGELNDLKPTEDLNSATDMASILDRKILAGIKKDPSPKYLADVVSVRTGGTFFAGRYGIGSDFLVGFSSDDINQTPIIWQMARQMSSQLGSDQISSVSVAAALIFAIPGHDAVLAQLNTDRQDIVNGVNWYTHMRKFIQFHSEKKNVGGIGRDLSFGWAPLLSKVGQNITDTIERGGFVKRPTAGHQGSIDQLAHLMSQPGRRNAVLVGQPGVGKTTIAFALAQQMIQKGKNIPESLHAQQMYTLNAANLISNARGRGELEELLIRLFNEAIAAKNVILFLDEAQLFMREGTGTVDLTSLLMPVIEGGALRIILSLDEQEWLKLSQLNPGLTQMMNRVQINELEEEEIRRVVEDEVLLLESQNKVVYMHQALKEAYRLSDRYIHEMAFPGKAIKLLESAAGFAEQKIFVTSKSVQEAVERTFNVTVQTASTSEEKNTLINLEELIHQRMINQTRAVKVVSDALRRARAGVRNQNKPIGTFLFLGPTGVGKTELSKSLAGVYFGGDERMVRIDLNEYSRASDTSRLIATAVQDPYSLCAQITKQPFSVVLLDEIEKAHPNVLNMLLQMLDEGVLRDNENKPVSFKDAIIIATSNAGADKIREHIQNGEQLETFEAAFINELIDANIFRPEFINRFDETVLFRPLSQEELLQVVDLLIASLNKTLVEKKVSVQLTQAAKIFLAQAGYDPRLGARPLRRVVQRGVENAIANKLLDGSVQPGQMVTIDAPELQVSLGSS